MDKQLFIVVLGLAAIGVFALGLVYYVVECFLGRKFSRFTYTFGFKSVIPIDITATRLKGEGFSVGETDACVYRCENSRIMFYLKIVPGKLGVLFFRGLLHRNANGWVLTCIYPTGVFFSFIYFATLCLAVLVKELIRGTLSFVPVIFFSIFLILLAAAAGAGRKRTTAAAQELLAVLGIGT